jgi:hypothetical protein
MPLALAGLYGLFGPDMRAARMAQMLGGAAAVLLVFDLARRAFGRPSAWIAALLWATFPQPIFYEAQFLTHGLEPQAAVLILWLWLRALEGRGWRWSAALGLAAGAAAVLRPTYLAVFPFIGLSLAWQSRPRWLEAAGRAVAFGLAALLPIAPITAWNYRAEGRFQLISGQSDVTLYLGNNRDSTGLGELSPAYRATHILVNRGQTTFLAQTFADIGAEPARWLQLMARKTMLYLGDPELPNNVDFYAEGTARSPLLARLPVRFGAMMALGLAGAFLALRRPEWRRAGLWILLGHIALQAAVVIGFSSFSRFRPPVYPALTILGGCAVASTAARLRARQGREAGLHLAALAMCGGLIAAMPFAAERVMSRPIVHELPAASRRLDAPIGEALTLVGHDPLPRVEPGDPAFITLYWQASRPLAADLYATVQVLSDGAAGGKIAQADQVLGTGGFPDYPPAEWQPGQIVRDRYLLEIPVDASTPRGLTVLVAAYHRETGERVGERSFGPLPLTFARPLDLPPDAQPLGAQVGTATLAAYRTALDTATLTLTLYWQAGAPLAEDAVVFVHLLDADGQYVLGQDTRPMGGRYGTLAWQPGEGVVDEHRLSLPAGLRPGEYQIAVGMYDAATQVRLPVVDASGQPVADGVVRLGVIALEK